MDVGVALPQYDYTAPGEARLPWETTVEWAATAERLGFDSLWLADHIFLSIEKYGGPAGRHPGLDPIVALAALARVTGRARLGTLVLCVPLRPPRVLAKALATIDVLAGGRLTVGIGAGWFEPEFLEAGVPFQPPSARIAQLAAAVEEMKDTWTGPLCRPAPVQRPHPPVWVGGRGDKTLAVAAGQADGWNAGGWVATHEEYAERVRALDRACENVGRDPATVTRSVNRFALVGEDETDLARRFERLVERTPPGVLDGMTLARWRQGRLVGTVEQVRQQLADWAGTGVHTVVVGLGALPFAVTGTGDLELLASALPSG